MSIIVELAGEPRMRDRVLAEKLGYEQLHKIKHLIERHWDRLERFGEVSSTVDETTAMGGRPGRSYYLNRKQTLYLCAKSETPRAAEVTIAMVEVFDAWLEGKTVPVREHMRRPPRQGVDEDAMSWAGPAPADHTDVRPFHYLETALPCGLRHVTAIVQENFAAQMHGAYMRQICVPADRWPRKALAKIDAELR